MNPSNSRMVLIGIAILCELAGAANWPGPDAKWNAIALGLVFFFISFLVP